MNIFPLINNFLLFPVHIGQCINVCYDVGHKDLPSLHTGITFLRHPKRDPGHEKVPVNDAAEIGYLVPGITVSKDQGQFPPLLH